MKTIYTFKCTVIDTTSPRKTTFNRKFSSMHKEPPLPHAERTNSEKKNVNPKNNTAS
jgi:hypothetical protein